jgi:GT2 family glycosyltransferase
MLEEWRPRFLERGINFEHVWQEDSGWRKNRIMNEAVRRAGDESLLLFSDGDCVPPARFVAHHLEVCEPRSLQVGGGVRWTQEVSESLTLEDVRSGVFEDWISSDQLRSLRKWARKSRWGTVLRRRRRPKVLGLNMAMDRELFELVNGFDEVFQLPYIGEDTDLRDRIMRLRPRPRVKVLYMLNDVFHMWHATKSTGRKHNMSYYQQKRPLRCTQGLVCSAPGVGDA